MSMGLQKGDAILKIIQQRVVDLTTTTTKANVK